MSNSSGKIAVVPCDDILVEDLPSPVEAGLRQRRPSATPAVPPPAALRQNNNLSAGEMPDPNRISPNNSRKNNSGGYNNNSGSNLLSSVAPQSAHNNSSGGSDKYVLLSPTSKKWTASFAASLGGPCELDPAPTSATAGGAAALSDDAQVPQHDARTSTTAAAAKAVRGTLSLTVVMGVSTAFVVLIVSVATVLVSTLTASEAIESLGSSFSKTLALSASSSVADYMGRFVDVVDGARLVMMSEDLKLPQDDDTLTHNRVCGALRAMMASLQFRIPGIALFAEPTPVSLTDGCGLFAISQYSEEGAYGCGVKRPQYSAPGVPTGSTVNSVAYFDRTSGVLIPDASRFAHLSMSDTTAKCSPTYKLLRSIVLNNAGGVVTTSIVAYRSVKSSTIATLNYALATAIFNSSNYFLGGLALSVPTDEFSLMLRRVDKSPRSTIWALSGSGDLLATTCETCELFSTTVQSKALAVPANCLSTEATVTTSSLTTQIVCPYKAEDGSKHGYAPMAALAVGDNAMLTATKFTLKKIRMPDGEDYFVSSAPVNSTARLFKLNILFFLPIDDLLGEIENGRNIAIGIAVAVLVAAIVLAVAIVYVVLLPLGKVVRKMQHAARLRLDDHDEEELSSIAEIRSLQTQFAAMYVAVGSFSKYVPKEVVKDLISSGQLCELGMTKAAVTILATDIAGFSSISERTPPEELSVAMTTYFDKLCGTVDSTGGTVNAFIGDALMVMWGAPALCMNQEIKACICALLIQRDCCTDPVRRAFDDLGEQIVTRVGINSGSEILVGNVGSHRRMTYTALGDPVNLAFRLEGQNKQFGTHCMISGAVHDKVQNIFCCRYIIPLAVVGKDEPTHVFELVGIKPQAAKNFDAVLDAKEEAMSTSLQSIVSVQSVHVRSNEGGAQLADSERRSANITARAMLEAAVKISQQSEQPRQSIIASDAEVSFCDEYTAAAQHFADGDATATIEALEMLKPERAAFFKEDAGDVADLLRLCGADRCQGSLVRAATSARVLARQAKMVMENSASSPNTPSLRKSCSSVNGKPALFMRSHDK